MSTPARPVNFKAPSLVDSLRRKLGFTLLPPRCLLCGACADAARDLCSACARDLLRNDIACARCALPLPLPAPLCGECLERPPAFDAALAPFVYTYPLDLLLTKLKFGRSLAAGRVLSELWLEALLTPLAMQSDPIPSVLIPVPLHARRLRERGYNQAHELALPLARVLGLEFAPNLLQRVRQTPAQTNLDAPTRRGNLRNAFEYMQPHQAGIENTAPPRHVALVDDVMTTGATLRECARTLKRAGVARVDVWAFARAPRRR